MVPSSTHNFGVSSLLCIESFAASTILLCLEFCLTKVHRAIVSTAISWMLPKVALIILSKPLFFLIIFSC